MINFSCKIKEKNNFKNTKAIIQKVIKKYKNNNKRY